MTRYLWLLSAFLIGSVACLPVLLYGSSTGVAGEPPSREMALKPTLPSPQSKLADIHLLSSQEELVTRELEAVASDGGEADSLEPTAAARRRFESSLAAAARYANSDDEPGEGVKGLTKLETKLKDGQADFKMVAELERLVRHRLQAAQAAVAAQAKLAEATAQYDASAYAEAVAACDDTGKIAKPFADEYPRWFSSIQAEMKATRPHAEVMARADSQLNAVAKSGPNRVTGLKAFLTAVRRDPQFAAALGAVPEQRGVKLIATVDLELGNLRLDELFGKRGGRSPGHGPSQMLKELGEVLDDHQQELIVQRARVEFKQWLSSRLVDKVAPVVKDQKLQDGISNKENLIIGDVRPRGDGKTHEFRAHEEGDVLQVMKAGQLEAFRVAPQAPIFPVRAVAKYQAALEPLRARPGDLDRWLAYERVCVNLDEDAVEFETAANRRIYPVAHKGFAKYYAAVSFSRERELGQAVIAHFETVKRLLVDANR